MHSLIVTMLTFYIFAMHADICSNMLAYLLRTLGQEHFVLKAFLMSYYGFGVTVSIFLSVINDFSYPGVWFGLLTSCYFMFAFASYKLYQLDWKEEVLKIANAMKKKSSLLETKDIELHNF